MRFLTFKVSQIGTLLAVFCLLAGCYKEQHFGFPGPYDEVNDRVPDTLPFPFDETRQAGVWLVKEGIADHGKMLFKGYTDFYPAGDTLSWAHDQTGVRMIPHRNYYPITNDDHFGGNQNSFQFNWAYSKYFVPVGAGKSFYMYTKVTIGTLNGTAAGLVLGRDWETGGMFFFGMDGGSEVVPTFWVNILGSAAIWIQPELGWPTVNEVIVPGVPAEIEVVIHDGQFYILINGTLCFLFRMPQGETYYFTPQIRPWRNFVTVHDFYIESTDAYTVDYAMHEYEQGYDRIQAPALAKAANGDLLLFAEGRSNPTSAAERVAQNTMPVGDSDIVMRRSTTGGSSWGDQITVIAGEGSMETYAFPQVVTTGDGKIILHYSAIPSRQLGNTYTHDGANQTVYQRESTDNGLSWSQPIDITASLTDGTSYVRNGPGHGIELTSAAFSKRLVMPLTYEGNAVRVALSDNGGQTWTVSEPVAGTNLMYGSLVELADGRLMMVLAHGNVSPGNKLVSYSSDGGETWSAATNLTSGVTTPGFSHMYHGVMVKGLQNEIHLISPTGRETDGETYNGPAYATSPAVFTSNDNGQSFSQAGQLFTRVAYHAYGAPTGLMDAVVLDDGTVVVVSEGGVESPREGIVTYRK